MHAKWLFCFDPEGTLFFSFDWIVVLSSSTCNVIENIPISVVDGLVIVFIYIPISIIITGACRHTILIDLFIIA